MWFLIALASAFMLGFYDVFKKKSLQGNAVIPVLFFITLVCSLLFLPFILLSASGTVGIGSELYIPMGTLENHKYVIIKALIVLSSWICGYYAIKHLPLTIAGPINATRPVLTLIGAFAIYGDKLNAWQWAGVILSVLSFFLLSRSGKKEGLNFFHNGWVMLLVLAALLGASSGLYDKYLMSPTEQGGLGMNKLFVQGWYNIYQCLLMLLVLCMVWLPSRGKSDKFVWRNSIILISLFLTAADLCYFYALSFPDALISIVSMVRRGSVIVSFFFGALIFHEKNLRSKTFDLLLVILGMICLCIGTFQLS